MTIIVPYRDRLQHLEQFIPHMRAYLPDAKIVVVEQADEKLFNRGKLLNIGFLESERDTHYVFHDVDMLPITVDYEPNAGVTQLAGSKIQLRDYLGGVTMVDHDTFKRVGGYNNDYFHRAEDNELRFNLHRLKIPVLELHGRFKQLQHERKAPEFIAALWDKAQKPRNVQDQLGVCKYELVSKDWMTESPIRSYMHLKVKL